MRTLLGLLLATVWSSAPGQSCTPAEPRTDPGTSFSAFASLERQQVRGGRPGNQDWEWGLGTNTQQTGSFVKSYLDWVSGRVLTYTLTYNGAGAGTFTVHDGATQLTTQSWNDPAKPLRAGNALKFYVKSSADSGTATVQATVATINGLPASGSIQTAGTITCQQASTPPGMYFIHVDHLNTPRLVANSSGTTVWRWDQQEPFGVNVPDENPSGLGAFDLPLRLPGQYYDKETNLHYNYFRDYDPSVGRYLESDALGLITARLPVPGTYLNHLYAYVASSPLSSDDPLALIELPQWLKKWGSGQSSGAGAGAVMGGQCAQIHCKRSFGTPASEADATQICLDLMDKSGLYRTPQYNRIFFICRDTCMQLTKNCKAMPVSFVQPIVVVQCQ